MHIKAILISLPPGMKHMITDTGSVKNLNKFFPVASASSWLEYTLMHEEEPHDGTKVSMALAGEAWVPKREYVKVRARGRGFNGCV